MTSVNPVHPLRKYKCWGNARDDGKRSIDSKGGQPFISVNPKCHEMNTGEDGCTETRTHRKFPHNNDDTNQTLSKRAVRRKYYAIKPADAVRTTEIEGSLPPATNLVVINLWMWRMQANLNHRSISKKPLTVNA